jgi:uncharacterized protein YndB with AHSA1/START domain
MSQFAITRDYPHSTSKVWHALTDPDLVPRWTATGRGGRPVGFAAVVGQHFQFRGKPVPGWKGVVDCVVKDVRPGVLLSHSWKGDEREPSLVTWRLAPTATGTRLVYEHTGFTGIDGVIMSRLVLGPIRRRMLDRGLPPVLDAIDDDGRPVPGRSLPPLP